MHPEVTEKDQNQKKTPNMISVAPGEGCTPLDIMFDKDWDVKSYPHIHQSNGTNGLDQGREVKLTSQRYLVNRIIHKEQKFSKCAPYLYAAVSHTEKKQLNRNHALSYTTGTRAQGENGKQVMNKTDAYRVFTGIKNTPTYYRQKKYELLAKLDNFGPFQVFWTISCADTRWQSNLTAALEELDPDWNVQFTSSSQVYQEDEILVHFTEDGNRRSKPIETFLKENVSESKHEIIRTNVVTATRIFDQRVKAFVK